LGSYTGGKKIPCSIISCGYECELAGTLYSIQGQTRAKLIAEFNKYKGNPPYTLEHVNVALSRVQDARDFRILKWIPGPGNKDHLLQMRFSDDYLMWNSSYDPKTGIFDSKRTMDLKTLPSPTTSSVFIKRPRRDVTLSSTSVTTSNNLPYQQIVIPITLRRTILPTTIPLNRSLELPWNQTLFTNDQRVYASDLANFYINAEIQEEVGRISHAYWLVPEMFKDLLPCTGWLDTTVISAFIAICLIEERRKPNNRPVTLLPDIVGKHIVAGRRRMEHDKEVGRNQEAEKDLLNESAKYSNDLLEHDILLPMNFDNTHWVAAMICPERETIYIIESMRRLHGYHAKTFGHICQWYEEQYFLRHNQPMPFKFKVNYGNSQTTPFQTDGCSCGVFTTFNLVCFLQHRCLADKDIHFNMNDMSSLRLYMTYKIISCMNVAEYRDIPITDFFLGSNTRVDLTT
jgi:hypothetical protein